MVPNCWVLCHGHDHAGGARPEYKGDESSGCLFRRF
jgi:hypothetical protein